MSAIRVSRIDAGACRALCEKAAGSACSPEAAAELARMALAAFPEVGAAVGRSARLAGRIGLHRTGAARTCGSWVELAPGAVAPEMEPLALAGAAIALDAARLDAADPRLAEAMAQLGGLRRGAGTRGPAYGLRALAPGSCLTT